MYDVGGCRDGAAERDASFGLATFELVMKRKLPLELVAGRRNRPHDLFKNPDVETYLEHLERAMTLAIETLGDRGRFEVFVNDTQIYSKLETGEFPEWPFIRDRVAELAPA